MAKSRGVLVMFRLRNGICLVSNQASTSLPKFASNPTRFRINELALLLHQRERHRLLKPELEQGFAWDLQLLSFFRSG